MQIMVAAVTAPLKSSPAPSYPADACGVYVAYYHTAHTEGTHKMGVCLPACSDLSLQQVKDPPSPLWSTEPQAAAEQQTPCPLRSDCAGKKRNKKTSVWFLTDKAFVLCSETFKPTQIVLVVEQAHVLTVFIQHRATAGAPDGRTPVPIVHPQQQQLSSGSHIRQESKSRGSSDT